MKIPFNKPPYVGTEDHYVLAAMKGMKLSGDGEFGKKVQDWFEKNTGSLKTLITPSCTHALEMAAILLDIKEGDEVIMPSYTFVSTANAFVLRGAKIVFVDIRPDTMNIDEKLISAAITKKTKAIVPVHYAGVACEMDTIMSIAREHNLFVVEDAAQGVTSKYKGKSLGTIGHLGAYSFHDTKNYTSGGEGGLLLINDDRFKARAEVIREKGTNRSQFFRGMVDKYGWMDIGSSYLPSELQSAYLWGQLEKNQEILVSRMNAWNFYYESLTALEQEGKIFRPTIPLHCEHNAHMFYIKTQNLEERTRLMESFKNQEIGAAFHYVPLHSSPAGACLSRFNGFDRWTTIESERLLRLPLWFGMKEAELNHVINALKLFYKN